MKKAKPNKKRTVCVYCKVPYKRVQSYDELGNKVGIAFICNCGTEVLKAPKHAVRKNWSCLL